MFQIGVDHKLPEPFYLRVGTALRDLEIIKIRELRRIFGCSFRCNAGRIVSYVTGITTETTAKKTSKACNLIFSKSLNTEGNVSAAAGVGLWLSEHAVIDVGYEYDNFPELELEFGQSYLFAAALKVFF